VADTESGSSVELDTPVGKAKIKGSDANNIATFATLIIVCVGGYVLYAHAEDAKKSGKEVAIEMRDSNKEVAKALRESQQELGIILKEVARAQRESNCLLSLPPERRSGQNAETCRRLSQ